LFEFIELMNTSDTPIDLSGVRFEDGIELAFVDGGFFVPLWVFVVRGPQELNGCRHSKWDIQVRLTN